MQRILVVDDVAEVRRRIAEALHGMRANIVQAVDGQAALDLVSEARVGVVVSDVRMPRVDGISLLRRLERFGIPVILHSGYADVGAAVEALRLGAVDFFPAPLDLTRLRRRVEHCLQRRESSDAVLIGTSPDMDEIRRLIERVADAPEPVLITGETGAGKEVVARAIHAAGRRRNGPFVAVNVAALPDSLLESDLFGHERGAFTGAIARRVGRFEQAHNGTILLDEIGDASPRAQAELLRVVETRCFERLGASQQLKSDVRILAATNRDLPVETARGRFRDDLWYRLSALRLHVPPLRHRRVDIDALVRHEINTLSSEWGSLPFELDAEGFALMRSHAWPGNARELRQIVRRMAILAGERRLLDREDVEQALSLEHTRTKDNVIEEESPFDVPSGEPTSRDEFASREKRDLIAALNANRWNVSAAARRLGISRGALRGRMRRFGIGVRSTDS